MIIAETAADPYPVENRDALLARLMKELPYSLDDYNIIAPQELLKDVLDDESTDWVEIRNIIDMNTAILEADMDEYDRL